MENSFVCEYEKLNNNDKKMFARICNKFLNETFIVKNKKNDKEDYYFVLDYLEMFNNYFKYIEYECVKNDRFGVIRIVSTEERNNVKFKKFDTVVILILRKLYYEQSTKMQSIDKIYTTLEEIDLEIRCTEIFDIEKKYERNYEGTLRLLKKYKIIDYVDKINQDMSIEILPTILLLVDENLPDLQTRINEFAQKRKDGENVDEDIKEN